MDLLKIVLCLLHVTSITVSCEEEVSDIDLEPSIEKNIEVSGYYFKPLDVLKPKNI